MFRLDVEPASKRRSAPILESREISQDIGEHGLHHVHAVGLAADLRGKDPPYGPSDEDRVVLVQVRLGTSVALTRRCKHLGEGGSMLYGNNSLNASSVRSSANSKREVCMDFRCS